MARRLMRSLEIIVSVAVFACTTEPTVGPRTLVGLTVAPDSVVVALGDSVHLNAIGLAPDSISYVGFPTAWATSDGAIVTVDDAGEVQAVGLGMATVTAAAGGYSAAAQVIVEPPPVIALSANSVAFTAVAGGPDPAVDSVLVTNSGGAQLTGLAIDSISYSSGATDWLQATLSGATAPTAVVLAPMIATLPPGSYQATVPVTSARATNSPQPITVTLTLTAAP